MEGCRFATFRCVCIIVEVVNEIPHYIFSLYSWVMCATAAVGSVVAVAAVHRRRASGVSYLALLGASAAAWALAYVFESAATTVELKLLWSVIAYPGTVAVPFFFFLFAINFSEFRYILTPRNILLFSIVPLFTVAAAATNNLHHLLWPFVTINAQNNIATYGHGPLFWLWYVYAYLLLSASIIVLILTILRSPFFFRLQSGAILIGVILPIAGNILYVSGINPIPGLDWTPAGFVLTGVVLLFSVFRLQILDLVPFARSKLLDIMQDGVLVVDDINRIVDINSPMEALIGRSSSEVVSQNIGQTLGGFGELLKLLHATPAEDTHSEICLENTDRKRYFDVRLSVLENPRGNLVGRFVILHDITTRKRVELQREQLIADLQQALGQVKTLRGLIPICSHCKKIRDDSGYWRNVEHYIKAHSDVEFSHSFCPECTKKYYSD